MNYVVKTEGDGGMGASMQILGYYSGNPNDIKSFLKGRGMYNIYLEPINFTNITPEMAQEKENTVNEIKRLNDKLTILNLKAGLKWR